MTFATNINGVINPRPITGGVTAISRAYDSTSEATIGQRTLTGVVGADAVVYSGGSASFADPNVGVGKSVTARGLTLTGADAGNYSVNGTATTIANISARALTATATDAGKVYGETDPALTFALGGAGLVGGDMLSGALVRAQGEGVAAKPATRSAREHWPRRRTMHWGSCPDGSPSRRAR